MTNIDRYLIPMISIAAEWNVNPHLRLVSEKNSKLNWGIGSINFQSEIPLRICHLVIYCITYLWKWTWGSFQSNIWFLNACSAAGSVSPWVPLGQQGRGKQGPHLINIFISYLQQQEELVRSEMLPAKIALLTGNTWKQDYSVHVLSHYTDESSHSL